MPPIPETFIQTQIKLNGVVGHAWVERLPAIVDSCARRWNLTIEPSSAPLSYNYVVLARGADGTAAIVKACAPAGEFAVQAAALRIYDGRGAVRLLEIDRDDEVMLLERCEPGTPLLAVEDEEREGDLYRGGDHAAVMAAGPAGPPAGSPAGSPVPLGRRLGQGAKAATRAFRRRYRAFPHCFGRAG